jgi:hypothetical protein
MVKRLAMAMGLACLVLANTALAAAEAAAGTGDSGFGLDLQLRQDSGDFGLGLGISSPRFFSLMHLVLDIDVHWKAGTLKGAADETWVPYGGARLGIMSGSDLADGAGRLYGGGGILALLPLGISDSPFGLGGFGVFGVQFYLEKSRHAAYFFEMGGEGSGLAADRFSGSPRAMNGFFAKTGFRLWL